MTTKFLIELPENDGITDLVDLMARYAKADWRVVQTLETADEKLARAVAALTGQILTPEPEQAVTMAAVSVHVPHPLQDAVDRMRPQLREIIRTKTEEMIAGMPVVTSEAVDPGESVVAHNEAAAASTTESGQAETPAAPKSEKGRCRYCGDPIPTRSQVCTKKECKTRQTTEWQQRYRAKKESQAEAAAQSAPVVQAEEAGEAPQAPFAETPGEPGEKGAVMYTVMSGPMTGQAMTFREMRQDIAAGRLLEGTRIQAHPSERCYVVRAGMLARPSDDPELSEEPGPGLVVTGTPA